MKANIGKIDYQIIKRLNENARLSSNALAAELHVSPRTVKNHINYLIDNDIIKPVAVVNPNMLGYNNITDISLWIDDKNFNSIYETCRSIEEVAYFSKQWESEGISMQARFKDFKELTQFINKLKDNPLIERLEYTIVPEVLYDTYSWLPKESDF